MLHGFNSFSNMVQVKIGFAVLILLINILASSTISSHCLNPFLLSVYFHVNWKCLIFASKSMMFYITSFMSWDRVPLMCFYFLVLSLLFFLQVILFVVVFPHLPLQPFSAAFLEINSKIVHTCTIGEKAKIVTVREDFWEEWSLDS